jgi:hypothetical protein
MPVSDSEISFKNANASMAIRDRNGLEIIAAIVEGNLTWSETGRAWVEAGKSRGRRSGRPVVVETDDGQISLSFSVKISTWLGDTEVSIREALTGKGKAASAGWQSTVDGGRWGTEIEFTWDGSEDGGATQSAKFAYVITDSLDVDTGQFDGLTGLSVSATDLENEPTYA